MTDAHRGHVKTIVLVCAAALLAASCSGDDRAPRVVSTSPANGSRDVDSALAEISVTFNEAMADNSWSWAYTDVAKFPAMSGQAYYDASYTTNKLPVRLEPRTEYEIWVNSETHRNFKDQAGNPANPFRLTFSTR